jgi:hypothetical protein
VSSLRSFLFFDCGHFALDRGRSLRGFSLTFLARFSPIYQNYRDNLDRSSVNEIMENIKRKIKEEDLSERTSHNPFTSSPVRSSSNRAVDRLT